MRDAVPTLRDTMLERPVYGTFLKLPRREVVEILALAGFDFAVCDLEHAQIDEAEAREVLLAGSHAGLPIVVRVPDLERGLINRLLEAGAAGIQAPRVRSAADAARLRELVEYPPEGSRSVSLQQPAAATRAGVSLGIFVARPADAAAAVSHGHRFLVVASDLSMLRDGAVAARG
jgi:4-hydroxy-2-oxoheptanedioate aldolase